jgi:hypothetical protein
MFYALRDLDEPHIRALVRLLHAEDRVRASIPPGEYHEERVTKALMEVTQKEPIPVIATLLNVGVADPGTLWGGGHAIARVSEFGRQLLADLSEDER